MECFDCKKPLEPGVPYAITEVGNLCVSCSEKRQPHCFDCKKLLEPGVPYEIHEDGNLCQSCAEKRQPVCEVCQERISGEMLIANEKQYHPGCFVCENCQTPIQGSFVLTGDGGLVCLTCNENSLPRCTACNGTLQGKIAIDGGDLYHEACFESVRNLPKCASCEKALRGEYLIVQNAKYHKDCFKCCLCRSPINGKYSPAGDAGVMCPSCADLSRRPEAVACKLTEKFRQFDVNGDGSISLDELRTILLTIGIPEADIPTIFSGADVNGDGHLDYNEFFTWLCGGKTEITTAVLKWQLPAVNKKPKPEENPKPPAKSVGQVKSGDMVLDIPDPESLNETEKKKAVDNILNVLLMNPIPFKRNKSDLMPEASHIIKEIANLLKHFKDLEILSEGHAAGHSHDNNAFRMNLSKSRAKTVNATLAESGVANMLWSAGVGSAQAAGMKVKIFAVDPAVARKRLELNPNFCLQPDMSKEEQIEALNCELKKVFEVKDTLSFQPNKVEWKDDYKPTIMECARVLNAASHLPVVVETCTTGEVSENDQMRMKVSQQRSDLVIAVLQSEGVRNTMTPIGLGSKEARGYQVRIRATNSA